MSLIAQQVQAAVQVNPHLSQSNVIVRTDADRVVLSGTVKSYFEKQMAQESLRGIDGIGAIENSLEVCWN